MSAGTKPAISEHPAIDEVIHCEKLTKRYHAGDILAVDQLDMAVHHGEIFGLLGPNGAGKTTTVGMLTTLVVPTSGKAVVAGIDVVAHPALAKQVIGVVAQTNNLDRALTVWENLYYHGLFFGMTSKESREASDKLLVEFRLTERAKAEIMAISGGRTATSSRYSCSVPATWIEPFRPAGWRACQTASACAGSSSTSKMR